MPAIALIRQAATKFRNYNAQLCFGLTVLSDPFNRFRYILFREYVSATFYPYRNFPRQSQTLQAESRAVRLLSRTLLTVRQHPFTDGLVSIIQACEQMGVKHLLTESTVEGRDAGILLRLAGRHVLDGNSTSLGPLQECLV